MNLCAFPLLCFAILLSSFSSLIEYLIETDQYDEPPNYSDCKLPNCFCMSTNPPKNMKPNEIPQLVFLTFDDAITVSNYDYYVSILKNRVNPNGQPISMTFYVTHEYNDYVKTHDLFYMGNEIACHSVT